MPTSIVKTERDEELWQKAKDIAEENGQKDNYALSIRLIAKRFGYSAMNKISGIYSIKNKVNGKIYIGKSQDVFGRWRQHLAYLRNNKHVNPHLQNAWNKYGEESFDFQIIENVPDMNTLDIREQWYVQQFNANDKSIGYNINEVDGQSYRASIETRMKQSEAQKRAWERTKEKRVKEMIESGRLEQMRLNNIGRKVTEIARLNMSKSRKGKKKTPEHIKAIADAHRGWIPSAETRKRIGDAHRGRTLKQSTRMKISASLLGKLRGPYKKKVEHAS